MTLVNNSSLSNLKPLNTLPVERQREIQSKGGKTKSPLKHYTAIRNGSKVLKLSNQEAHWRSCIMQGDLMSVMSELLVYDLEECESDSDKRRELFLKLGSFQKLINERERWRIEYTDSDQESVEKLKTAVFEVCTAEQRELILLRIAGVEGWK